jgi:hypothetical protein
MSRVKVRLVDDVEPGRLKRNHELFADSLVSGHSAEGPLLQGLDRIIAQDASSLAHSARTNVKRTSNVGTTEKDVISSQ